MKKIIIVEEWNDRVAWVVAEIVGWLKVNDKIETGFFSKDKNVSGRVNLLD